MPRGRPKKKDDALLKSAELLGWALGGLEREISQTRERLGSLTAQAAKLRQRVGSGVASAVGGVKAASSEMPKGRGGRKGAGKRRQMSAEARQRISDMMKKRWAERRKKGA